MADQKPAGDSHGYQPRFNDLVRQDRLGNLPTDIPTIYQPFSIAALTGTVQKLLARD